MKRISKYLDYSSELDRDDILKEIRNFSGYCYPFNWSLKRGDRYTTLLKTITTSLLMGIVFVIYIFTLPKAIVFDTVYVAEITLITFYLGYLLIICWNNLINRRSLCTIFYLINSGFSEFGDIHEKYEIKERDRVNERWKVYCKAGTSFFFIFPVLLVFLIFDNCKRDPKTLPDWFDPRLPVPVVLPVDTSNPLIYVFCLSYEFYVTVFFSLFMKSYSSCVLKVGLTAICEIRLITKAIQRFERKAHEKYMRLYDPIGRSINKFGAIDRVKLYANEKFRTIYRERLKNIIRHHQQINKFIDCINNVYGYDIAYTEYLTGLGLATYLHITLNEKNSLSLRIFSILPLSGIYSLIGIFCIICQKITDQLSDLHEEIYMSQWIDADESFKRTMMIFHSKTLKPVYIKSSFSGTCLNLSFMITITKACYSIINFLLMMKKG